MLKRTLVLALALVGLMFGAAMQANAEPLVALTNTNSLIRFDSAAPSAFVTTTVTGLQAGDGLVGIDFRPANGLLYGFARDTAVSPGFGPNGRIYTIDPLTGQATLVSTLSSSIVGNVAVGTDFNPVVDRLRIVAENEQNLRVNVDTGATIVDGNLNPGDFGVSGAAYTNNFAGATSTTLYVIDSLSDALYIQNPPNDGTLVRVGSLGVDTNNFIGFDISGLTGVAYATFRTPTGGATLYTINLATGQATSLGLISATLGIRGLAAPVGTAAVPEPATMILLGTGLAGIAAKVRHRRKANE